MKNYVKLIALIVILSAAGSAAQKGVKSDKNSRLRAVTGTPAQTILDINNVTTWVRNDGFFSWVVEGSWNGTFPKGTIGDIYSQGIVWGGFVNDGKSPLLRVGGSTYSTGLRGGAILTDAHGNVTGVDDPTSSSVRIFRVRPDYATADLRDDASCFLVKKLTDVTDGDMDGLRTQYAKDWAEWPGDKGAPYTDVNGNGKYDPSADIPGIPGADQTIWFVSNDIGGYQVYGSPAIGLEMQMTMWGYTSELFSNVQFKRVRLIYKGTPTTPSGSTISDMFITQWADPDLGDYSDDFAGCDTVRSLGYVYNGKAQDAYYLGRFNLAPPAIGFDFMQGVRVKTNNLSDTAIFNFQKWPGYKNIGMTTFSYFAAGSQRSDPDLGAYNGALQWYNLMRGCEPRPAYPDCVPFKNDAGQVTRFEKAGDPVAGGTDLDGSPIGPADRRILLCTGTFSMALGDTQEVVVAQVDGLGSNNISSVAVMKNVDDLAQVAYDNLFKALPGAPDPPRPVVTQLNNEIILDWGSDPAQIGKIENVPKQGWTFEGYNVYQLPTATSNLKAAVPLATYDLVDNVKAIFNRGFDPTAGTFVNVVKQVGTDRGVQRYIDITQDAVNSRPLVNGLTYYFVVTAYSYNSSVNTDYHALESNYSVLAVTPQSSVGVSVPTQYGQVIALSGSAQHVQGASEIIPAVTIVQPTVLTGHTYQLRFDTIGGAFKWVFRDTTRRKDLDSSTNLGSIVALANAATFADSLVANNADSKFPIIDGMLLGIKEKVPAIKSSATKWVSSNPVWIYGSRFASDVAAAFNGGVTTGAQLPTYLGHVATSFNDFNSFPVEVRFDAAHPQKAYRLRRTGAGSSYMIQATNPFVNVPFSVWDMSNSASPRQLTVAWRDQNDDALWNPPVDVDDGLEIVLIYNKTYNSSGTGQFSMPPAEIADECTSGANADIVYGLSLGVLAGHTLSESTGKLEIVPYLHLTLKDKFVFSTTKADTSSARAASDVERVNVFPNPYYGYNSQETDRLQKYVTFSHLPAMATIRIFNLGGVAVRMINHNGGQFERWNLRNDSNLPVASGIYIAYVDMPTLGKTKILKLAIVQEEQILRIY